mgnify:FL=1|jgi:hypothetical protein|tara:strand:- start:468 stop:605 length:138 start_codon:yes stop_codon:yes gene_type:complete
MEKTIKDIIKNSQNELQDNCYNGLFWDLETKKFLRWNELIKKECK